MRSTLKRGLVLALLVVAVVLAILAIRASLPSAVPAAPKPPKPPTEPTPMDPGADGCGLWQTETAFTSFDFELRLQEGRRIPMRMPSVYFCGGERGDGHTHVAQLFYVRISDFTPLSCGRDDGAGWDSMSLLLSDHIPQREKVRHNLDYGGPPPEAYATAPWHYGLTRYFDYPEQRRTDVYTSGPVEAPDVVLRCKPEGSVPSPSCNMLLEVEDVDLTIGIRRTELPNWTIIADRARRFISCGIAAASED